MDESHLSAKIETRDIECPTCGGIVKIPLITSPVLGGHEIYPDYNNYTINNMMEIIKYQNNIIEKLLVYAKLESEVRKLGFEKK